MTNLLTNLLMIMLILMALFLILLVLVQRGRGGGLAGAFGGMGGQSAFGTKAGDLFTRITIVVATLWILLCLVADKKLTAEKEEILDVGGTAQNASGTPGSKALGTTSKGAASKGAEPAAPSGDLKSDEGKAGDTGGGAAIKQSTPAGGTESAPAAGAAGAPAEKDGTPPDEKK